MPAEVIGGFVSYVQANIDGLTLWDGEIPVRDTEQSPIEIDAGPVFRVIIDESGLHRETTFENAYVENGPIEFQVWATTRAVVHAQLNTMEALLSLNSNWAQVNIGTPLYVLFDLAITDWYEGQIENVRTMTGNLIYYGWLRYGLELSGSVARQPN